MPISTTTQREITMPYVKVGPRHQITIPQEVREAAGISAGDLLEIMTQRGKVVIIPKQVVSRPVAVRLSKKEQEVLLTAKKKIKAIQDDMINSTGLNRAEADVAAKIGLIATDQRWWWLESWQEGEREVERNYAEGNFEEFDNAEDFIKSLKSL